MIYGGFFVLLTAAFLAFVFWGTDLWRAKLPILSKVQPFNFTAEDGQSFTEKNMQGKVCVVNYFFTTCKGICPRMNGNLKKIYEVYKDKPDFMIVSHTSDPERDIPSILKDYAKYNMKVDTKNWVFLTGRKDLLYQQARDSYLLDDPKNSVLNINDQFLHTQFVALVDKNGKVRGQIYDGLKEKDLKMLEEDINKLLNEGQTDTNFANGSYNNNL